MQSETESTNLGPASSANLGWAIQHVHDAVARSGLAETLAPFSIYAATARPETDALLKCYASASAAQNRFSEAEHMVVRALDLETAFSSNWWAALITAVARASIPQNIAQEVSELCTRLRLLTHNLDRLAPLLDRLAPLAPLLDRLAPEGVATAAPGAGLLMRLPSNHGAPPTLRQVAATIEAVDLLATAVSELLGSAETMQLAAAAVDGALEFRGSEPITRSMNALVTTIREHMGVYSSIGLKEQAAAIAPLLPINGLIGGRPDAARLRSLLEAGIGRLLAAGWSVAPPQAPAVYRSADTAPGETTALPADLASLIAGERRRLSAKTGDARRLWPQSPPPPSFEMPSRPSLDGRPI